MALRLQIRNLSYNTGAEVLGKLFEKIGIVKSAVIETEEGKSLGYGFVEMENAELALLCLQQLNNTYLDGRNIHISVEGENTGNSYQTQPQTRRINNQRPPQSAVSQNKNNFVPNRNVNRRSAVNTYDDVYDEYDRDDQFNGNQQRNRFNNQRLPPPPNSYRTPPSIPNDSYRPYTTQRFSRNDNFDGYSRGRQYNEVDNYTQIPQQRRQTQSNRYNNINNWDQNYQTQNRAQTSYEQPAQGGRARRGGQGRNRRGNQGGNWNANAAPFFGPSRSYGFNGRRYNRGARNDVPQEMSKQRLYINNLPFDLTSAELGQIFTDKGIKVKEVSLQSRRFSTALNMGFGFIEVENEEEQIRVLKVHPTIKIKDRECPLRKATIHVARTGHVQPDKIPDVKEGEASGSEGGEGKK